MVNEEGAIVIPHDGELIPQLKQGVEVWNEWRKNNYRSQINFRGVDLNGINLRGADLSNVFFLEANLSGANFSQAMLWSANLSRADLSDGNLEKFELTDTNFNGANLSRANLSSAKLNGANLSRANLSSAKLNGATLSFAELQNVNLSGADLSGADLSMTNLSEANLSGANLSNTNLYKAELNADLSRANLSGANLSEANLSGANLSSADLDEANLFRTRALSTNFNKAIFTRACIEDWHTNSLTNLNGVICDYVYLRQGQQERRPSSGNFAPGEFTKLFQKALETVDLIFRNGVDWDAFDYSFKKVEVENLGVQLDVQSIEKKGDGVLVVRVSVSPDADKAKIHNEFMQGYQIASEVLSAQYQARLEDKDKHINQLFYLLNQANENQGEVLKRMSESPKYDMRESSFPGGFAETNYGKMVETQINYATQQNLAEAAAEIQQLLTQLQTEGFEPKENPGQAAREIVRQAKNDPTVKNKLVKWGQYLDDAAAQGIIGDAAVKVITLALSLLV